MAAAPEILGLMNVEGLSYEVCVRNTFIHVARRPSKRRMSAPAVLSVQNFDNAVAEDTNDGTIYSLDDYDSLSEACDSSLDDILDARPRCLNTSSNFKDIFAPMEMQDEADVASVKTDVHQSDCSRQTSAGDGASASDDCANSVERLRASEPRNSLVDGRSCKAQAAASKSKGRRGSAKSKAITRMFIGNLPCSMSTGRMVMELCQHGFFGTYTSVNLPRKPDGTGRGYGFVTFCSAEEAQRFASMFRGCEFEGHRCYVNPAAHQSNPCVSP